MRLHLSWPIQVRSFQQREAKKKKKKKSVYTSTVTCQDKTGPNKPPSLFVCHKNAGNVSHEANPNSTAAYHIQKLMAKSTRINQMVEDHLPEWWVISCVPLAR